MTKSVRDCPTYFENLLKQEKGQREKKGLTDHAVVVNVDDEFATPSTTSVTTIG